MRYKFFTSVPLVVRERWAHSGKSMICRLQPSDLFELFAYLRPPKGFSQAHSISNTIQSHFFHFSIFGIHTFFLSRILPPTAIMPVSRFSLISIADIFAADFEPFSILHNNQRHPNHFPEKQKSEYSFYFTTVIFLTLRSAFDVYHSRRRPRFGMMNKSDFIVMSGTYRYRNIKKSVQIIEKKRLLRPTNPR